MFRRKLQSFIEVGDRRVHLSRIELDEAAQAPGRLIGRIEIDRRREVRDSLPGLTNLVVRSAPAP